MHTHTHCKIYDGRKKEHRREEERKGEKRRQKLREKMDGYVRACEMVTAEKENI